MDNNEYNIPTVELNNKVERPNPLIAPRVDKRVPRWKKARNAAARMAMYFLAAASSMAAPLGLDKVVPNESSEIAAPTQRRNEAYRGALDKQSNSKNFVSNNFTPINPNTGSNIIITETQTTETNTPHLEFSVPKEVSQIYQ